jgi:hypothetical protein
MPDVERRVIGKKDRRQHTEVITLIWTLQAVVVRMQNTIDEIKAEVFRIGTKIGSGDGTTPADIGAILDPVVEKLKNVK